jgi:exopolysaccharide/PEP-CTERM locus tyrosine autokinase
MFCGFRFFENFICIFNDGVAGKKVTFMSKIEKALKKAKAMRQEVPLQGPSKVSELPSSGLSQEPLPQNPVYTETKTVSLNKGHLEKHRVMTLVDNPAVTDYYNILRTQVLSRTRKKGHNTLMVTSVIGGEGKTITAVNLAVSIAREVKQTVLLVDADLRTPTIDTYLGFQGELGLSDYLLGDVPVSDLLINPGLDKMVFLPAGKPLLGSTEMLGSPKMEKLVKEMKRRYPERYVIIDSPPILSVSDALVCASYVDGVILVVEAGRTPKDKIRKAVEVLEEHNIVGLVMNKGDVGPHGYF